MLPPEVATANGNPGAHTYRLVGSFGGDFGPLWLAWVRYDLQLDDMVALLSHELVEVATDPEPGGGWFDDTLEHRRGEIADLCEVHGRWPTAYVGNAKVSAYWSARDRECVIPTHPLSVRIDGKVAVDERIPDGEDSVDHPFGADPGLCALLPVCCFSGPYSWTRTRVVETASLHATASGYHAASSTWSIGGVAVSGQGTVGVEAGVTRETPNGPTYSFETIVLRYAQAGSRLTVTNDAVAGSFEVTVTVAADETEASEGLGGKRTAAVVLPFHGLELAWDPRFLSDQQLCADASQALWEKTHPQRRRGPHVPIDPGPLHRDDVTLLASLGASVSEQRRQAAHVVLWHAQQLRAHHPREAVHLRRALLAGLGIASAPAARAPVPGGADSGDELDGEGGIRTRDGA
jgi:hypothetical protein